MSPHTLVESPHVLLLADAPVVAPGSPAEALLAGLIGRKALGLAQLQQHGLPVPPAGAITTAAYAAMLGPLEGDTAAALLTAPLPEGLETAIGLLYEQLGRGKVAVRSSGAAEDLAGASFAGMYESYLDVDGEAAVIAAVRRCWASAWTERVATYAERQGIAQRDLAMGVVIQRLVPADAAGVMFTLDPTTGREDALRVEAVHGLGEALVQGTAQPDGYVIRRRDGRALDVTLVAERPVLEASQLEALAALGRQAQAFYGCPQDVEFAFAAGKLWLLQSRPITTVNFTGIEGEWTTADFKDGGVSASVCSPYMWSLYDSIWQVTMPTYLRQIKLLRHHDPVLWGRVFYGRPYWNCGEVKRALHRVPGFNERTFDRDLGIEGAYEGDGTVIPTTPWTILGALPTLFALGVAYDERLAQNAAFKQAFEGIAERYAADPAGLPREALAARYRQLVREDYFVTESAYFYTIYNTSNAKLDFKVELDKVNEGLEQPLSYLELLSGLQDLSHLRPLRDLWTLAGAAPRDLVLNTPAEQLQGVLSAQAPAFWDRLAGFLFKYRHHAMAELDITQPRWDEDPVFVLRTLQSYVATYAPERDPSRSSERQFQVYLDELRRAEGVFKGKDPLTRLVAYGNLKGVEDGFFAKLHRCRQYAWWREEMRDLSSRMYALIRRETLAVARVLTHEGTLERVDDIWFLRFAEVIDLLAGGDVRALVAERREYNAGWTRFENPNELGSRFKQGGPAFPAEGALVGIGCSPGRVKARVRVVSAIGEAHKLEPGEVLVTKFTDPGWTPLFSSLAAVVTETGGVLSHAAVIAREYGIPAVLAVPGATQRLRDGQWVLVDGQAGTVTLVEDEA
ncbi:MAG: phosphoenolpyruvate synthase/pyruvate phosphate dikinase [Cyanobacteria bacterium RYN_339]|nr:phosphoenolpyruvate synthase/pyruvate phosphate dikinase [Cyanobacteria bacterium RYN_339]